MELGIALEGKIAGIGIGIGIETETGNGVFSGSSDRGGLAERMLMLRPCW